MRVKKNFNPVGDAFPLFPRIHVYAVVQTKGQGQKEGGRVRGDHGGPRPGLPLHDPGQQRHDRGVPTLQSRGLGSGQLEAPRPSSPAVTATPAAY